jgi:hypothetical protein
LTRVGSRHRDEDYEHFMPNSNIKNTTMKNFKSKKTKKKFKESELTQKNARKIASKLGFGSGHELVELIKIDEETYRLWAVPYYGAPTQTDEFRLNKKHMKEKTAVDLLWEGLTCLAFQENIPKEAIEVYEQAKQAHKEQITEAFGEGVDVYCENTFLSGHHTTISEAYYKQKYGDK